MSVTASTPESSAASASAATATATAPGAEPAATALDIQFAEFARDWLGIELGAEERARVRGAIAMLEAQQRMQASQATQATQASAGAARRPAGRAIDLDRQRIQNLIDQHLSRTQVTVLGNASAERAAESAVLGAVERAQSLDDLRPPKPAAGAGANANQAPRTDPLIAQIADQLTGLIKREVDACFQQQFGPLASQLQAVIDAAQDSGLLARKSDSASLDESRGTAENSGKTAEKPEQNNNDNNAAKAPASASQRD
ncbi:hypothetical protein [Lysobacter sp. Root690]|uniref:hypothetical protein n=1 Tax=Lysobacter sp. Root690 TaxID=1736588 RepID=UPI0006FEA53B|nr:hypothetical protein [Lysobacter sp. Root690]KRB03339.1 hypothetical protein ASD86_20890 [Lysobacter sp. Root690]